MCNAMKATLHVLGAREKQMFHTVHYLLTPVLTGTAKLTSIETFTDSHLMCKPEADSSPMIPILTIKPGHFWVGGKCFQHCS